MPPRRPKVTAILAGLDLSRWARLLSVTATAQIGVQALAFAGGILIIRLLPQSEYALYTLATALLGTMTALADSGVSAAVTAQAARVWSDEKRLATVLQVGLSLRRRFAIVALAVSIPWAMYLFRGHGATWPSALLIVVMLLPSFYTSLSGSLLAIPLKLQRRTGVLQWTQLGANVARLVALLAALTALPISAAALACNTVGQVLQNVRMRFLQKSLLQTPAADDPTARSEILRTVGRLLPGTIYYAFFGQITVWILSVLGSTRSIAQVGALTRLTMILSVLSSVFALIILPRFATIPTDPKRVRARFVQTQAGMLIVTAAFTVAVWLFPTQSLWVLGRDYADLGRELVVATAGACIGLLGGMVYTLNTARGRVPAGFVYPLTGIATTAVLAALLRPSDASGAVLFSLLLNVVTLLVGNLVFFLVPERSRPPAPQG